MCKKASDSKFESDHWGWLWQCDMWLGEAPFWCLFLASSYVQVSFFFYRSPRLHLSEGQLTWTSCNAAGMTSYLTSAWVAYNLIWLNLIIIYQPKSWPFLTNLCTSPLYKKNKQTEKHFKGWLMVWLLQFAQHHIWHPAQFPTFSAVFVCCLLPPLVLLQWSPSWPHSQPTSQNLLHVPHAWSVTMGKLLLEMTP